MSLSILVVTAEAFPLAKTGGLGDAISGMVRALPISATTSFNILLPAYRGALAQLSQPRQIAELNNLPGGNAQLLSGKCPALGNAQILLLKNDALYDRDGLYVDINGNEYPDNALRFAALSHAALRIAHGTAGLPRPRVIHAHDWHTSLIPLLLHAAGLEDIKSILTVHNMAFQGIFDRAHAPALGLPTRSLYADALEYWGKINFLKAGIHYATCITTVSHTYAREILTERFGCGLQSLLASRQQDLIALPNGIDTEEWDPATDIYLQEHCFHPNKIENKGRCKTRLQQCFNLPLAPRAPLLIMVSRLTHQKMADIAAQALAHALNKYPDLQVAVMGQGDKLLENALKTLQHHYPKRCRIQIGFDEKTAHLMHAGGDLLLHGSRFEPFGLTPLYAMRYGTLPVASQVGGMADTISDPGPQADHAAMHNATGVLFQGENAEAMNAAIHRALTLYQHPSLWQAMQQRAMRTDFSWKNVIPAYVNLYRLLMASDFPPSKNSAPTAATRASHHFDHAPAHSIGKTLKASWFTALNTLTRKHLSHGR